MSNINAIEIIAVIKETSAIPNGIIPTSPPGKFVLLK